ncbi:MAG: hypothetical protein WCM76_13430 [Bacteroidota bacterium]
MKKNLIIALLITLNSVVFAQISGTKTIPGDYATISAAIAALNGSGVGTGGVTFNVAAGHIETISATLSLIVSGTSSNPIIFQKNGAGNNPKITAYGGGTATPSSAIQDGIIQLVGCDYVTFNGIDLYDPNTSNPSTMEYGYGLFQLNANNGCQHNTIINCVITLNRNNSAVSSVFASTGSRAIYIVNSLFTAQNALSTPSSAAGTNSYNKIYSNTLQNCHYGVMISGYNAQTPFTLGDTGNDVGGTSATTGNSILNFGGTNTTLSTCGAISMTYQFGSNISYNTINNNNGSGVNNQAGILGIYSVSYAEPSVLISHNNLNLHSASSTIIDAGIYVISGTGTLGLVIVSNNVITGSNPAATTSNFYAIRNECTCNVQIDSNTISGISQNGVEGSFIGVIYNNTQAGNVHCYHNTISNITKNNKGYIYAIYYKGTANVDIRYNSITNLTSATTTTLYADVYGILTETFDTAVIKNNLIHDFSHSSGGGVYGISCNSISYCDSNEIHTFSASAGARLYGIESKIKKRTISNHCCPVKV